tara:strand:+ start:63451 stop:66126 length:2676 start_codon:yes stop_codon:yes gene_type:complete
MKSTPSFLSVIKEKAKILFLSWQYQSLNIPEVRPYDLRMASISSPTSNPHEKIKTLLNDSLFWQKLKEDPKSSAESIQLKNQWESVREFADFTAQELMQFKWHTLDPYEIFILRALEELQTDLKRYQLNGVWRPKWMLRWHQDKIGALEEEYQKFLDIKKKLQCNLLLKTRLYSLLGVSKYIDDIYLYFATKINQLKVIHPNALAMPEVSTALSDDTRIAVHDYLSAGLFIKEPELEDIILPISQKPYSVPIEPKQIEAELRALNIFTTKTEYLLGLTSLTKFKQEKQESEKVGAWLDTWVLSTLSRFITTNKLTRKIKDIWYYRWVLALIMTVGAYFWLASAAISFIGLIMGSWASSVASNVLFYGVALLPAYIIGFKALTHFGETIYNALGYWKARDIQESIELLKLNQRFIGGELSSGIKEVTFFDIVQLESNAQVALRNINKAIVELDAVRGTAKFVYWGRIKQANLEVVAKLKWQKQEIHSRLEIYASHIGERLAQNLATFHNDIIKGRFSPTIPKSQIQALHQFVAQYGNEQAQKKFTQSTNVLGLFASQLWGNKLLFRVDHPTTLNQPWGGFKSNVPSLKGWCTLIKYFEMDKLRQEAAINIIKVLMGQKICELSELNQWVAVVGHENGPKLIKNIQQYIFLTLDNQPSAHANLLSEVQKILINNWVEQNKAVIELAKNFMLSLKNDREPCKRLCQMEDMTLIKYFEALEGLERYEAEETIFSIRAILKKYDGSASNAVYFLKFLPAHLKKDIAVQMLGRRLNWLIEHLDSLLENIFDSHDTELFKHPALNGVYSFGDAVRAQRQYMQPWDERFSQFLLQCKQNGFDDGTLSEDYETFNARVKQFVNNISQEILILSNTTPNPITSKLEYTEPARIVPGGIRCV